MLPELRLFGTSSLGCLLKRRKRSKGHLVVLILCIHDSFTKLQLGLSVYFRCVLGARVVALGEMVVE